jgi:hypothetical protein
MSSNNPIPPVTIALGPRKKSFIVTADELMTAILGFLVQSHAIEVVTLAYEGCRATKDEMDDFMKWGNHRSITEITLSGISENGQAWEKDREIYFKIDGKCLTSLDTRIGSGPFPLVIRKGTGARNRQWSTHQEPESIIFRGFAQPNPDRTISFLSAKL